MANAWEFTVTSTRLFPLDMLRYDACYPTDSESVAEMDASFSGHERVDRHKAGKTFTVKLRSRVGSPELKRWASFGWNVKDLRKVRV